MASTTMKIISIVITADSICPFCYLGFTKIHRAIATVKDRQLPLEFNLRLVPYQLDPTLPTDRPISKRERFAAKFGAARFDQMEKMMSERFKQEGLSITYDGTVRQTTLSQRLIAQAYAVGGAETQMKTVEGIYRKYFSEGKDIGDVAVLVPVSVENGVFEGEETAKAWLEGTEGMEEYNAGVLAAQKAGISGVPFFRINDKWGVSGAQDPEVFVKIFERIADGEIV